MEKVSWVTALPQAGRCQLESQLHSEGRTVSTYVLGHSEHELERLANQARLIDPITRRFFAEAGIRRGMRVLDVGSGAGDVSFLTAELVGRTGHVTGVDRAPGAVAAATDRARSRSLSNVVFVEGDPSAMTFDRPFDAVVGRYVLMFQTDPVEMVRRLASHREPDGLLAFHEVDWDGFRSRPALPTYDRCGAWVRATLRASGADGNMGLGLHATFLRAGLPAPTMRSETLVGGASGQGAYLDLLTQIVVTLLPEMERLGITTADEADAATLTDRMIQESERCLSAIAGRSEIGAWARRP